jgi:hypothetical protein
MTTPHTSGPDPAGARELEGRRRWNVPTRVALLGALIVLALIFTSSGSIRSWWAHRLHDLTGGSWGGDYVLGLAVGLLPLAGVVAGALSARRRHGVVRVLRMVWFGATGFVVTYLLAPSPASWLSHHASTRVFDQQIPGYLPGAFTGAMLWLAALVVGMLRARSWWRRFTARRTPPEQGGRRVIDV